LICFGRPYVQQRHHKVAPICVHLYNLSLPGALLQLARQGTGLPTANIIPPSMQRHSLLGALIGSLSLHVAHDLAYHADQLCISLGIQP
jgi:hypothetical protein